MIGMTRDDLKLILQFFFTFSITAGSIIGGAMLEKGTPQMPHSAVILLALIVGFMTAAQRAQADMQGKPQQDLESTVRQLVAQMRTVQVVTAQQLPPTPAEAVTPRRATLSSSGKPEGWE